MSETSSGRTAFPLRVGKEVKETLALYAAIAGISMNEVATRAVVVYMRDNDPPVPAEALRFEARTVFPLRLDRSVRQQLRVYAAIAGQNMNDVATVAVVRYLGEERRAAMIERVRKRGLEERE